MDYSNELKKYNQCPSAGQIGQIVTQARADVSRNEKAEVWKLCYSCLDLTSLGSADSEQSIGEFTRKAVEFPLHFPKMPNVAAICVYPSMVEVVGLTLGNSPIAIASVAGGFPASQTYLEVKALETAMAIENGADEIDTVINVGQMLTGEYDRMAGEIEVLKGETGDDALLKVIVESGALKTPELIWNASILAMLAGADFVKTSTGKIPVSATPEAAATMCLAIREYAARTGRKVGFKAAGGIATTAEALLYYTIVETILGREWLSPTLFRIGASSLANKLLETVEGREITYF